MQDDVNGAGWCLADYFNGMGIRYLNMGINKTRSLLPFDKPTCFWWESPSGKRVLAYRSDHYMTGNFWGVEKGEAELIKPHVAELPELAGGAPLSLRPCRRPVLRLLHRQLAAFDRRLRPGRRPGTRNTPGRTCASRPRRNSSPGSRRSTADKLDVHRQAWPDWWTDGFGSAARETAADRETETAMDVNQRLLAMARLLGAPDSRPDEPARRRHPRQSPVLRRAHFRRRREHQRSAGRKRPDAMGREILLRLDCGQRLGPVARGSLWPGAGFPAPRRRPHAGRVQYPELAPLRHGPRLHRPPDPPAATASSASWTARNPCSRRRWNAAPKALTGRCG